MDVLYVLVLWEEPAGGDANESLEMAGKVALVDKAHEKSGFGNGMAEAQKGLGSQDAELDLVFVRGHSNFAAEGAVQMTGA